MDPRAAEVLDFWFGPTDVARDVWFRKDAAFDATVRQRFANDIELALAGGLPGWAGAPATALARVLLLDQFTRNIFRDTPRAFAGDALALAAAREMLSRGQDLALSPLRRVFAYLPFEHAEDMAAQHEALRLFAALSAQARDLAGFEDYARRHAVVIERFGRFPHRNAVLARPSTPEELEFLNQPGSTF